MATHWLARGVAPQVVSARLGHSSVAFTMQVYGHVLPGQQAAAAAEMADDLVRRGNRTAIGGASEVAKPGETSNSEQLTNLPKTPL